MFTTHVAEHMHTAAHDTRCASVSDDVVEALLRRSARISRYSIRHRASFAVGRGGARSATAGLGKGDLCPTTSVSLPERNSHFHFKQTLLQNACRLPAWLSLWAVLCVTLCRFYPPQSLFGLVLAGCQSLCARRGAARRCARWRGSGSKDDDDGHLADEKSLLSPGR